MFYFLLHWGPGFEKEVPKVKVQSFLGVITIGGKSENTFWEPRNQVITFCGIIVIASWTWVHIFK